uniref:Uncharacterized protein n=1 Tax=Candidatus Kentrum sp. TC TaxID=2126339 RepID=A0A450YJ50_9GAMM|nr:MAG: hypothetical protein BECKTC1821E_GA0114239_101211 [Candidatus Kentron sp. TC]
MKITASHIVEWANTYAREAQDQLPRLIRRLCFYPDAIHAISFPAGDSIYRPGWDGVLSSEKGNAWIPVGESRWEIGCDRDPTPKASADYHKRTKETGEEERSISTFVFVTPRRWSKKSVWLAERHAKGQWKDVRAYDGDDLEQWLEQTPAVALQFAEELGLIGPGVESLSRHWDSWSRQCNPAITADAFLAGRTPVRDALAEKIRSALSQPVSSHFLTIRADSVEEAAAFAVAVVMASGLRDQVLVVTEPEGWRYVEANPQIGIAIAARAETAQNPVLREGLLIIVPPRHGRPGCELQGGGTGPGTPRYLRIRTCPRRHGRGGIRRPALCREHRPLLDRVPPPAGREPRHPASRLAGCAPVGHADPGVSAQGMVR